MYELQHLKILALPISYSRGSLCYRTVQICINCQTKFVWHLEQHQSRWLAQNPIFSYTSVVRLRVTLHNTINQLRAIDSAFLNCSHNVHLTRIRGSRSQMYNICIIYDLSSFPPRHQYTIDTLHVQFYLDYLERHHALVKCSQNWNKCIIPNGLIIIEDAV